MPSKILYNTLLAAAILASASAHAAPVTELSPDKLAAYVAKNELVVVQLTSPDPKCKYCVGADKTFDQAAAQATNPKMKFARVQWPVWHKMPNFAPLFSATGIPRQLVFRGGKEMQSAGGRPENAQVLLQHIDEILALPAAPGKHYAATVPAAASGSAAPHTPMTAEQRDASRVMIRRDYLASVTQACATMFPKQAGQYQKALDQWRSPRKDKLSQGELLMVTRTSREDANETTLLAEAEQKTIKAWQVDKLGIPMDRAPQVKDCDKITASFESL
jgi:serine protease inhibitor ecotin